MDKKKVLTSINPLFLSGIAHRGLFNKEIMENSLLAFERAIEAKVAIELDIHLTKDNKLVVIHDEDLKRLTGKEGIVEHLTLNELKENYKLLDGQEIPSFEEVLKLVDEQVPLVIELKVYEKNYKALAKKTSEVLNRYIKNKNNFMLISFDPRSLLPLKNMGLVRVLLVVHTHLYVYNLFHYFFDGIDIEYKLLKEKRFQRYGKKHFINAWTIENKEQLDFIVPYVDTVTYQFMSPDVIETALRNEK